MMGRGANLCLDYPRITVGLRPRGNVVSQAVQGDVLDRLTDVLSSLAVIVGVVGFFLWRSTGPRMDGPKEPIDMGKVMGKGGGAPSTGGAPSSGGAMKMGGGATPSGAATPAGSAGGS